MFRTIRAGKREIEKDTEELKRMGEQLEFLKNLGWRNYSGAEDFT